MAFLDWEKAFDKVRHDNLSIDMERLGFSKHYTDVINNCYMNPAFFVRYNFWKSENRKQITGIRQGCPLSPYLFVMVMSCIDHDIRSHCSGHVKNNRLPGLGFEMVYYADDTILISTDTGGLNKLLRLTEEVSSQYGLKLNRDKCVAIAMNIDGNIHFQDNTPL